MSSLASAKWVIPVFVTGRCGSPGWPELNSNSSMHELPFLIMRTLQPASGTPNAVFIGLMPEGMSADITCSKPSTPQ